MGRGAEINVCVRPLCVHTGEKLWYMYHLYLLYERVSNGPPGLGEGGGEEDRGRGGTTERAAVQFSSKQHLQFKMFVSF